jgi:hypothetical protein
MLFYTVVKRFNVAAESAEEALKVAEGKIDLEPAEARPLATGPGELSLFRDVGVGEAFTCHTRDEPGLWRVLYKKIDGTEHNAAPCLPGGAPTTFYDADPVYVHPEYFGRV